MLLLPLSWGKAAYIESRNMQNALTLTLDIYRAWLLSVIVEKSKKCVDFTFTCFFIHTVVCTIYDVSNVINVIFLPIVHL